MSNKKLWVGLGIGCGTLVLLGVVGLGAAFFWAKGKVEDAGAAFQDLSRQQDELAALDRDFAFEPPEDDAPLALRAERLEAYLAVRQDGLRVFKAFEAKGKAFENEHGKEAQGLGATMDAAKLLGQLASDVRAGYITSLKAHRMSPREFRAITEAVYTTYLSGMAEGAREAMQSQKAAMQEQLEETRAQLREEGLAEAERSALEGQRTLLEQQLASADEQVEEAPAAAHRAVLKANTALLAQHKARIEEALNPAFDAFVAGGEQ